jgi:hypothetical protein
MKGAPNLRAEVHDSANAGASAGTTARTNVARASVRITPGRSQPMKVHPFQNASALVMLLADWVVYAITMLSHFDGWGASTLVASVATLVLVASIESRAPAESRRSLMRAIIAALLVAAPLPVLGTLAAIVSLVWNGARRHEAHG